MPDGPIGMPLSTGSSSHCTAVAFSFATTHTSYRPIWFDRACVTFVDLVSHRAFDGLLLSVHLATFVPGPRPAVVADRPHTPRAVLEPEEPVRVRSSHDAALIQKDMISATTRQRDHFHGVGALTVGTPSIESAGSVGV